MVYGGGGRVAGLSVVVEADFARGHDEGEGGNHECGAHKHNGDLEDGRAGDSEQLEHGGCGRWCEGVEGGGV